MARSIAGMVLAQIRNSAKMSQLQLAQAMGISAQMVSFLETGQRSLSKTKTRTVERALWGTRADRERCDTLHAAIRADEICDILLCECDETIDMIFSEPLTREVGHNLVLALSTNDIFTREEKNKILDSLKESIEHSFRINDIRAVNVRNQGYYYLSRSGGVGIKEYLGEVYNEKRMMFVLEASQ